MKSFLKEIEDKFIELENHCDSCDRPADQCVCEDDLEEQNVTGAIAGYSTPNAFRKTVKRVGYATGIEESVNTSPTFNKHKEEYQRPESEEEEWMEKFAYAPDNTKWTNAKYDYPSVDQTHLPGTANKHKHMVEEAMDRKYEQLIESYRNFATADPKTSPEQKVKNTIREVAKRLQEIETMVNYNSRLKTESGVTSSAYGTSTKNALAKISERLIKISERIRSLGE
jgi:hypothetical protein